MDVTLKIHRYVEGKSWVDTFTVPRSTGLTVLGALTYIKEQQDPTLSFTCSCRSSICGACAVRVNGEVYGHLDSREKIENLLQTLQ